MKSKITESQRDWIREHHNEYKSLKELLSVFNEMFCQDISYETFSSFTCKTLKIKRKSNSGHFKRGDKIRSLPVGTIKKSQVGTYIKVKEEIESGKKYSGYCKPCWVPLQEKIYQDHYKQEVPPGCFVCFLDGDKENFSPENLYPINRKISAYLSKNKLWKADAEQTKTAILLAQLVQAIK